MRRSKINTCKLLTSGVLFGIAATSYAQESSVDLNVYGFIQLDTSYDKNRVAPQSNDTLRPSKVATIDGQFGSDGEMVFSMRPSTLGVKGSIASPQGNV